MENIKKNTNWKKYLPYGIIIAVFATLSLYYFLPVLSGKVIEQSDIKLFVGSAQEILKYRSENGGEDPYWTNSMFSGMPDYQITTDFKFNFIKHLDSILRFLPRPADYIFLAFISFFILMLSLGTDKLKALLGGLMYGLSSYFFTIIAAGHNSKMHALAYLPLVFASVILVYKRKYILGTILMALSMGLEVYSNHPQMTYYAALALAILVIVNLVDAIRNKQYAHFFKATALLAAGAIIGIGLNAGRLWSTWEYQKYTIRGGSELAESSQKTNGLDKNYLLAWSYGKGETLNLMIPNLYGGSSNTDLGENSNFYKTIYELTNSKETAHSYAQNAPAYWGDQPFTSGPSYVGAIVVFLFILGLLIVKNKYKWWLAAATLLSFMIAWGSNLMWFADFMIDYFPLYNKFRTPSSALIIAGITMPMLAVMALSTWIKDENLSIIEKKQRKIHFYIALGITSAICIALIFISRAFLDFKSPFDMQMFGQYPKIIRSLEQDRYELLSSDAFRSLAFIAFTAMALWFVFKKKLSVYKATIFIIILVVLDLWLVDKRYLNDANFTDKTSMSEPFRGSAAAYFAPQINSDTSYFRVLNKSVNTINDASTSYYFHSLGGYHAAKIARYQDLWDYHISKGNMQVINMLNTKYIILPAEQENQMPKAVINPSTNGAAWLVDSIVVVNSPRNEIFALNDIDTKQIAVLDSSWAKNINNIKTSEQNKGEIKIISYKPNHLIYNAKVEKPVLAVFSEIYYPKGWNVYVNGEKTPYTRANYVLRALPLDKGEYKIEFIFEPTSVKIGDIISLISFIILIGAVIFVVWKKYKQRKNEKNPSSI